MKRTAHVAGIANIESGIISLRLKSLSLRPSSATSSSPSAWCSPGPPPVEDMLTQIQDGTYTTHESKRDLTGRKIFNHLCYVQNRHGFQVGLKGEWSLTAETALCLWLSSPKKGFRQKTVETTLAITDMPATTALAIADTPDTENLNNTNDDRTVHSSSSGSSSSSSSSGSDSSMPQTKRGLHAHVKKLKASNAQLKADFEETSKDLFLATEILVMMGLAEKGKTPAAQALALAISEYWMLVDNMVWDVKPSFRLCSSLHQLRGEPRKKHVPDILDDPDMNVIPMPELKAFLDASLEESFTVERWTTSKFVRNQLRILCDNKINEDADRWISPGQATIPHEVFLHHRPGLPREVMFALVVNTNRACYIRKAGTGTNPVPLIQYEDGVMDFISDSGKALLDRMKSGGKSPPSDWLEKRQWSHDFVSMVLEKGRAPERTTVTFEKCLFDKTKRRVERKPDVPFSGRVVVDLESTDLVAPASRTEHPAAPRATKPATAPWTPVPVKKEPGVFASLPMASGSAPIDLNTPSPRPAQAKRRRVHCDGSASEDDDGLPRVGEAPEDDCVCAKETLQKLTKSTPPSTGWGHFRDVHGSAIMYFIALSEYPAASIPMTFAIGHEVHVKCDSLDKKHPGKPRANGKRKPYGYGWFMAVDPRTLRVLVVSCLHQPEGNEVMDGILTRLLPKCPLLDGVVLDRACAFLPHAKRTRKFAQVGYWCVDYFHGAKHSDHCPCNPHHVRRLARRFANVNTSAAEQVFSWFRQYARVLNELSPHRHQLKVLVFCTLHNDVCRGGRPGYLSRSLTNVRRYQRHTAVARSA
ncbi:unnamed protein product [Symbiodinium microadriaticum]|nr:unnamed protein product [Symbiodinium microadriaticum]CAE7488183.1 unnamed protein product [Symbiodinium sp. KB8]